MRLPLPGNCNAQSSTHAGKLSGQRWNVHALPPAYGKQNNRRRADGFSLENTNQREAVPNAVDVIIVFCRKEAQKSQNQFLWFLCLLWLKIAN
jgi:hypothetical protein